MITLLHIFHTVCRWKRLENLSIFIWRKDVDKSLQF